jgi:hypothetical protein
MLWNVLAAYLSKFSLNKPRKLSNMLLPTHERLIDYKWIWKWWVAHCVHIEQMHISCWCRTIRFFWNFYTRIDWPNHRVTFCIHWVAERKKFPLNYFKPKWRDFTSDMNIHLTLKRWLPHLRRPLSHWKYLVASGLLRRRNPLSSLLPKTDPLLPRGDLWPPKDRGCRSFRHSIGQILAFVVLGKGHTPMG